MSGKNASGGLQPLATYQPRMSIPVRRPRANTSPRPRWTGVGLFENPSARVEFHGQDTYKHLGSVTSAAALRREGRTEGPKGRKGKR